MSKTREISFACSQLHLRDFVMIIANEIIFYRAIGPVRVIPVLHEDLEITYYRVDDPKISEKIGTACRDMNPEKGKVLIEFSTKKMEFLMGTVEKWVVNYKVTGLGGTSDRDEIREVVERVRGMAERESDTFARLSVKRADSSLPIPFNMNIRARR